LPSTVDANLGPAISPAKKERVELLITSAEAEGEMMCYQEEIFGPALICFMDDLEHAIDLINAN
jgi:acyl-CoA reductase-like NAD-dependent aldehyde dehydrogenase